MRGAAERFVVLPVFHVPVLEHVADQPEKPVVVDLFRQDLQEDLVRDFPEAVGYVSLDEPHGPGPGVLHVPQCGVAPPVFPEAVRPARELRFVVRLKEQAYDFADELV